MADVKEAGLAGGGKYQAYSEYNDSGVEWLGLVPSSWKVKRLKYLAALVTDKAGSRNYPVGLENIEGWTGRFVPTNSEFQGEGISFQEEDILFGKLRPYLAKVLLAEQPGEAVGDFHVLRPASGACSRYLQYQMLTKEFISIVDGSTFGAKMPRVSWEFMANLLCAQPSESEAGTIAAFLDYETARIDDLIAKQQRLIELLKEKRQAVISHAVTKGLNPDAQMKDSGVEWLGQVPEHWNEVPLKALVSLKHGYAFDGNKFSDSGEYKLLTPGHFYEHGGFKARKVEKYYSGDDYPREYILNRDQMLVAMTEQAEGLLGSVLTVPSDGEYLHNQRLGLIEVLNLDKLEPDYLYHLFNTKRYRAEVSITATGAKVRHTSADKMLSIKVWLPPLKEQQKIATFVSKTLLSLDNAERKSLELVERLLERRTALISAAVTGKIDLRGWELPA